MDYSVLNKSFARKPVKLLIGVTDDDFLIELNVPEVSKLAIIYQMIAPHSDFCGGRDWSFKHKPNLNLNLSLNLIEALSELFQKG